MTKPWNPIRYKDAQGLWVSDNEILEAIEKSAYFKWEEAGRPEGRSDQFWIEAEDDVRRSLVRQPFDQGYIFVQDYPNITHTPVIIDPETERNPIEESFSFKYNEKAYNVLLGMWQWNNPLTWLHGSKETSDKKITTHREKIYE